MCVNQIARVRLYRSRDCRLAYGSSSDRSLPPADSRYTCEVPALKRIVKFGTTGLDAKAVKRALARAGYGPKKLAGISPIFGPFSVIFLNRWKKSMGFTPDGQLRQQGLDALWPFFDDLARSWYEAYKPPPPPSVYVNPFKHTTGLRCERTDDGVDYFGDRNSPIGAIGKSKIIEATTNSNWPGPYPNGGFNGKGGLIHGVFLDGPNAGEEWYLAEFIYVDVVPGQIVEAGQKIARFYYDASSGVGIEYGFGVGGDHQYATEAGKCFARLLRKTGAPTLEDPGPGSSHSPFGKTVI